MSDHDNAPTGPIIPVTSTNSTSTTSSVMLSQPEQFWMRCQQPELTLLLRKSSINFNRDDDKYSEIEATTDDDSVQNASTTSNVMTVAEPTSSDLVLSSTTTTTAPNKTYDIDQPLSFNTILVLVTGFTVAIAVFYSWYVAPMESINKLKEKIYQLQVENGNLHLELERCQLSLNRPDPEYACIESLDKYDSAGDRALTADNDSDVDEFHHDNTVVMGISGDGEKLENTNKNEHSKTVWTGEGKNILTEILSTEKHFKYEHLCDEDIHDDLFSEYIINYCKAIKKKKDKHNSDNKKAIKQPIHIHEILKERNEIIEKDSAEISVLQKMFNPEENSKDLMDSNEKLDNSKEKLNLVNQYDLLRPPLKKEKFNVEDEIFTEKPKLINQYDLPRPSLIDEVYDSTVPQFEIPQDFFTEKPKLVNQYDLPRHQHTQRKSKKEKSKNSGYENNEKPTPSKHDEFEFKSDFLSDFLDPNHINGEMHQFNANDNDDDFDFDYSQEDTKPEFAKTLNYEGYHYDDDGIDITYRKRGIVLSEEVYDLLAKSDYYSLPGLDSYTVDKKFGDDDTYDDIKLSQKEQKKSKEKLRKEEKKARKERNWEKKEKKQHKKDKRSYKTYDD